MKGGKCKDYLAENYVLTADLEIWIAFAATAGSGTSLRMLSGIRDVGPSAGCCPALMLAESEPVELHVAKHPFVPADKASRADTRCAQIFDMQATALARRLRITGGKLTVGISGGLDSTLALLAACRAMEVMDCHERTSPA